MTAMSGLYKELKIWRRIDNRAAIRFFCLFDLSSGMFAVQSADFFRLPVTKEQLENFDKQYLELFMEISPVERCEWFNSLTEAITAHDRGFSQ
jgi:hypothetical protein